MLTGVYVRLYAFFSPLISEVRVFPVSHCRRSATHSVCRCDKTSNAILTNRQLRVNNVLLHMMDEMYQLVDGFILNDEINTVQRAFGKKLPNALVISCILQDYFS